MASEREALIALLSKRDGQDFDGEVHLSSAEASRIIAALATRPSTASEVAVRIVATALCEAAGMPADQPGKYGYSWINHEVDARKVLAALSGQESRS